MSDLIDRINAFPSKRVVVLGDVMLDEYLWGSASRISPEAPVPVVEVARRTYSAGGAANAAANAAGLGAIVVLSGVMGADAHGDHLSRAIQEAGIDGDGIIAVPERPTTTKSRIIAHDHQVARMDVERRGSFGADTEARLLDWADRQVPKADVCILSDYNKGVVSASIASGFIEIARSAGVPIVVDPKGTHYSKYRGATIASPNVLETATALNVQIETEADLVEAGGHLLTILESDGLLVTRGAEGMSLFCDGSDVVHVPASARSVFDVTGAGDTVVAVLALALASGATLVEGAKLATAAAGVAVSKLGTARVTLVELQEALESTEVNLT